MRKIVVTACLTATISALAAGVWAADRSERRAKEVAADNGSIQVRAGGLLNTTVEVIDKNRIANAEFDFQLIEDHRAPLVALGFTTVRVETANGESLERPL